ncbi:MAG: pyridoxal-5-phosphate-dependent protein subunit beta [Elusimicrobia bacterium CG06_land_8_20_14_3_00_38_11]|nr:MAG: pyridoxal-5-phosphate-dependent protein subunit beta [Elusimicrobia bacterium CG06_land_8_20_14_3_00_38_11]
MVKVKVNERVLAKMVGRCKEKGIIIPTFAQQKDPSKIPAKIKGALKDIGLWDVNPLNLFRITWKNHPKENGGDGSFGGVNCIEIPPALSGVKARIVGLAGKWFPTGAHKVGAAFGCLVPRLVTGEFDPTSQKAVWPSTGNYCRGGAFDCALLACDAIAILPKEMSKERFDWLKEIGTKEIFATPGCESNVKEIYDKCWELRKERGNKIVIFNQFDEFGNCCWHYEMTGSAIEEVFSQMSGKNKKLRLSGYVSATGSAGTIGAGEYLKKKFPLVKIGASEALQCPTLYLNGFGGHRIEGIGDKHVPWIHNVRNTDNVIAIDDEYTMRLLRLFNEEAGRKVLEKEGVKKELLDKLPVLGISSICNLLASIKMAKYYELNENDVIFTIFTDSSDMYKSRLKELEAERGKYSEEYAIVDLKKCLQGIGIDWIKELNYYDRKALHNLKYFTWVEQQGKTVEELNALWHPEFWDETFAQIPVWDKLIEEFNNKTGLLKKL